MKLIIPDLSLVMLVGASGCGKSTFAAKHFKPTETVSSDACRGIVSDDENSQESTVEAFDLLHYITRKRLTAGKLTVVDATNVQPESRRPLLKIADEYHVPLVAIVFMLSDEICHERNKERPNRQFGEHVVRSHNRELRRSVERLEREGFRHVYILRSPTQVDNAELQRIPLWPDRKNETGPFDIIGDIHGCFDETHELMEKLGYKIQKLDPQPEIAMEDVRSFVRGSNDWSWLPRFYDVRPPEGRKAIFLGDLVDRGPNSPDVIKLVMSMLHDGTGICIPGNHDQKFMRKLRGRDVQITHGLAETLQQFEKEPKEFHDVTARFFDSLVSHYVLDGGNLVVAHAGMKDEMQGRASARVRDFALYGETTGETDEFGFPGRYNWAGDYRGKATVVYGHTPVFEPEWLNKTINIDTGCVFGGKLTALRYPEIELVSVLPRATYAEAVRPLLGSEVSAQHLHDDVLDLADVSGKRIIHTRLRGNTTLREENAIAALEAMSRFAANPRWLAYLPPTMSPSETSQKEGLLEHPAEAFQYFRAMGVQKVVCEEKHMGSRAVVALCRDAGVAQRRFGVAGDERGIVYTRTGRRFFDDLEMEAALLDRFDKAMEASGTWETLNTDWVILDCELMPWSAKAQELLRKQYAPVGASATKATAATAAVLEQINLRDEELAPLKQRMTQRAQMAEAYVNAYRHYCWPVASIEDLRLAPFHILASEGAVHADKDHVWHMETLANICGQDPKLIFATPYKIIDTFDEASEATGIQWWEEMTATGGEGMVVKPFNFVATGAKDVIQPAVKCRGREYLRIIYGPDYDLPENIERLRKRGLGRKRSLAIREFALGIEALERFVRKEPLRRVHECVFAVLALESEPVDPRL